MGLVSTSSPTLQPSFSATEIFKWGLMTVALLTVTAPAFWIFGHQPETPVAPAVWALVVLSALANVIVIAYHYTIPAHPKFLMLPWRRWLIRIHIFSGTVELVAGLIACTGNAPVAARIAALAALCLHVPSAFFQTRIVFGSKAIMVPSYLLCILTHAFCAAMLLTHPDSRMWAVNTFLVFNVYVWCRIYYYVFDLLQLFGNQKYTIAILAAGATMIPALFGAFGFMLLAGFIAIYILLYRLLFIRSPAAYASFVRERARDSALPAGVKPQWNLGGEAAAHAADFFKLVDRDRDGVLSREELRGSLTPWGLPEQAIDAFAERMLASGPVDLPRFETEVWSIGAVRDHGTRAVATSQAESERDKAELVFRHVDIDNDGVLTRHELDLLLLEWGLPASETDRYLRRVAGGGSRITFEHFYKHMRPVWTYIFYQVFRAEYGSHRGEMIGRSVSAMLDARKTDALRQKLKQDLLARVPFLQGASEELIADLAASLVTERYASGAEIFVEGSVGNRFYLVGSGMVRVTRGGEVLADLGSGGCLGEGALLTDEPRSATLIAMEDAVMFSLTRASFEYLTEKYPGVREQLRALHEQRRVATNRLALERRLIGHVPFLIGADSTLQADLAAALVPLQRRTGDVIIAEGQPGDRLFIIEHGMVRVSRAGETLAHLSTGACFGEGALLSDNPRAATATAMTPMRLFSLSRADFERITQRYPGVRAALLDLHRTRSPFVPAQRAAVA